MAEEPQNKAQSDAEKEAVDEATQTYNDLIAALILIATSNRAKKEKFKMIDSWESRMKKWNSNFAETQTKKIYGDFSKKAFIEGETLLPKKNIKKKAFGFQEQELGNLSDQLETGLNRRLGTLTDQARQLAINQELERIRELKLGMTDASDRIQITRKKSVKDLVFTNQKGKVVKMDAVMRLTVGDQIWKVITSSQRSQWLLMGFRYGQHISVIDSSTTIICRALHLTRRDLTKDQLPPMHPGCRSRIKLLKDGWDSQTFEKNFGK